MGVRAYVCGVLFAGFASAATAGIVADVGVTKTGPAIAAADSQVDYTITVANLGGTPAAAVTLDDALPAGMEFVSATQTSGPTFTCGTPAAGATSGAINCTLDTMPVDAVATFVFSFRIPAATPPG